MKRFAVALAAMLVLTCAGVASAQNAGTKAAPAKVQRAWLEHQRIYIEVFVANEIDPDPAGNPDTPGTYPYGEHFANRLGDVIPVRVRIFLIQPESDKERKVQIDFSALKSGRLTIEPDQDNDPDWWFAEKEVLGPGEKPVDIPVAPKKVYLLTPDGKERAAELWDIKMFVQTKRRPEPMVFWMEFSYAADLTLNGNLDWKQASTPDYIISQSRTADAGPDLCMGNTSLLQQHRPLVLAAVLMCLGVVLVGIPVTRVGLRALRKRLGRSVQQDPAEEAWAVFDPILASARTKRGHYKFTTEQVTEIVRAFKKFYAIPYSVAQLESKRYELDDGEEVYRILLALEHGVLERGEGLSEKRYAELMRRIEKLCPRP